MSCRLKKKKKIRYTHHTHYYAIVYRQLSFHYIKKKKKYCFGACICNQCGYKILYYVMGIAAHTTTVVYFTYGPSGFFIYETNLILRVFLGNQYAFYVFSCLDE